MVRPALADRADCSCCRQVPQVVANSGTPSETIAVKNVFRPRAELLHRKELFLVSTAIE